MAHRLDQVAIGVKHEDGIVGGVVCQAKAERAVVAATSGKPGGVKGVHRGTAGARKHQCRLSGTTVPVVAQMSI